MVQRIIWPIYGYNWEYIRRREQWYPTCLQSIKVTGRFFCTLNVHTVSCMEDFTHYNLTMSIQQPRCAWCIKFKFCMIVWYLNEMHLDQGVTIYIAEVIHVYQAQYLGLGSRNLTSYSYRLYQAATITCLWNNYCRVLLLHSSPVIDLAIISRRSFNANVL